MGTDGACGLLFCAAKRSGAFPPNMPAGLRARVSHSAVSRGRSPGNCFPQLGPGSLSSWDSEFTSTEATVQGDSAEFASTLNAKLWDLVVASFRFLAKFSF